VRKKGKFYCKVSESLVLSANKVERYGYPMAESQS